MANVHHDYFDKFVISTLSTSEREKEWKACLIPYAMILVSGKRICVCKLLYIWHDIFCGSFVSFYLGITIHLMGLTSFITIMLIICFTWRFTPKIAIVRYSNYEQTKKMKIVKKLFIFRWTHEWSLIIAVKLFRFICERKTSGRY